MKRCQIARPLTVDACKNGKHATNRPPYTKNKPKSMMKKSRILGAGHYVPERIVTNQELSEMMNTSDDWIVERTGIHERRWFTPGVDTVTNMAVKASRMALERSGKEASEIDFIVFATITSDYFLPGNGVLLQR